MGASCAKEPRVKATQQPGSSRADELGRRGSIQAELNQEDADCDDNADQAQWAQEPPLETPDRQQLPNVYRDIKQDTLTTCHSILKALDLDSGPQAEERGRALLKLAEASFSTAGTAGTAELSVSLERALSFGSEALKTGHSMVEVLSNALPTGAGVIFGLIQLALERFGAVQEIRDACRQLLRMAVDFLGVLEVGQTKLPADSPADRPEYLQGIREAVSLVCAVESSTWRRFSMAIRDELHSQTEQLKELRQRYQLNFVVAMAPTGAEADVRLPKSIITTDEHYRLVGALQQQPTECVQVVLLHGLGGLGKSTLAKVAYMAARDHFGQGNYGYCMLDPDKGSDAKHLQEELGSMLFHLRLSISDNDRLAALHSRMVSQLAPASRQAPVLLLVDDVLDSTVAAKLLGEEPGGLASLLPAGSRVLMTSRSSTAADLLEGPGVQVKKWPVGLLEAGYAEKLLCSSMDLAYRGSALTGGKLSEQLGSALVKKLVGHCAGLPLALRVLGSVVGLEGREEGVASARETAQQLLQGDRQAHRDLDKQLQGVLASTIARLDPAYRQAFLDVAWYYAPSETPWALAESALDEPGHRKVLRLLLSLSLVERRPRRKGREDCVGMHAQLVMVGHRLMKDASFSAEAYFGGIDPSGARFDDASNPLAGAKAAEHRGVVLSIPSTSALTPGDIHSFLLAEEGPTPAQLRVLVIEEHGSGSITTVRIPTAFTCLRIIKIECKALVELDGFEGLTQLRSLDLSNCRQLRVLPDSIGQLRSLQVLNLRSCGQLQQLPNSIGQLGGLQQLNLGSCTQLQSLPGSIGQLGSLRRLDLGSCRQLQLLPDSLSQLSSLQALLVDGCSRIQLLPDIFAQLHSLTVLNLCSSEQLQQLPGSISQLRSLQAVNLNYCRRLRSLPDFSGSSSTLTALYLSQCSQLQSLPGSIGRLGGLQLLDASYCEQLQSLPAAFGQLSGLRELHLTGCKQLRSLPDSLGQLGSLQLLRLAGCSQLQSLPASIGQLSSLKSLDLYSCGQLPALPDSISQLGSLQYLSLCACPQLRSLPARINQQGSLRQLDLRGCCEQLLQSVADSSAQLGSLQCLYLGGSGQVQWPPAFFGQLGSLRELAVRECFQLQSLPNSIGELGSLQRLYLGQCEQLRSLPASLVQLGSLHNLHLWGCRQLEFLPDSISNLRSLQNLLLEGCEHLQRLPACMGQLSSLEVLKLSGCKQLQQLPASIGQLGSLLRANLHSCEQLQQLPDSIGQLGSLQQLTLMYCMQLQQLPASIGQLGSLQELTLAYCKQLQQLPASIGQLSSLQRLRLSGCEQLQLLPSSIGQLSSLQNLDISECSQLQLLPPSIGQLGSLQELYMSNCRQLRALPDSIVQLGSLEFVKMFGCEQLKSLPASFGQLGNPKIVGFQK